MVTLLGFFAIIANVLLLEICDPELIGAAPGWVYCSFGLGVWL